jgi:hypothetical protein
MTWLITIIVMSDVDRVDLDRAATIFSIFDFNNTKIMSSDELAIMILCALSSFGFILNRVNDVPADIYVTKFTETIIYDDLNKITGSQISAEEFTTWVRDHIVGPGYKHIDEIFDKIAKDCHKIEIQLAKEREELNDRLKVKQERKSLGELHANAMLAEVEAYEFTSNSDTYVALEQVDNTATLEESYGDEAFHESEVLDSQVKEGSNDINGDVSPTVEVIAQTGASEEELPVAQSEDIEARAEEKSITPTNASIQAKVSAEGMKACIEDKAGSPIDGKGDSKGEASDDEYSEESFDAQSTSSANNGSAESKVNDKDLSALESKRADKSSKE